MPPPPPPPLHHHRHIHLLPPLLAAAIALAFFLLSAIAYRKITRKRTVPTDLKQPPFPPQRFSSSLLRRATSSFSASNRIGQGGFGSVYKGVLPSGQEVAVKLMSEVSIQGEREFQNELTLASSPESYCVRINDVEEGGGAVAVEAEAETLSMSERLEKEGSVSEGILDETSVESVNRNRGKSESGRNWWWKQENASGLSESGRVKDYVMEWIGSEISKERPKKDWVDKTTSSIEDGSGKTEVKKKGKKKLEWWASLDRVTTRKEKKNKEPKEWWKEEFCEELAKKKKKRDHNEGESWWQREEDGVPERKKRRSRGSRSSIDRWIDGFSGEFKIGRRNSQDWASGEIPKSGGISSTPSMRGTVCYIAPEYGGGARVSDKCDVYSFGVLLLVIVSGRRPLQVMASPMSDFERANLISWARQLALNGKLLDLVDSNIVSLDREQALLCITIAILCLQRSPNKRPSMKEIVEMLSGKAEPPHLPFEFSPSPPSNFPFKSWKKAR
ncbi:hypothetical protein ACJIZ3_018403 [Penstemon smallii]|uniref:Protein kinase domain-containing protein n=1 Tax=Penstemon smallii TaxID=265156 RepID=A0ABD3SZ52_9LAMI